MTHTSHALRDKVVFITGGSRGIGREIALRAAADGAAVVLAAKTDTPHPKLPGTVHSVADEVRAAGGQALAVITDIRDEQQVTAAVARAVAHFGGIDVLVNNASAISLTGTLQTPVKRFDLMMSVNARGTFVTSQACLPHLLKADNPHILNLSPPVNLDPRWLAPHVAYTLAKYGMTLCALGMAEEFAGQGLAANCLWPRTVIATAAIQLLPGVDPAACRSPRIVADAAHWILTQPSSACSGNCFIDETVLRQAGVTDFEQYAQRPGTPLLPDLFLDE